MTKYEDDPIFAQHASPLDVTFLVLPGSSIMTVASAVDPLRAANRIMGREAFRFALVSLDGAAAVTTCGLPVAVTGPLKPSGRTGLFAVIAGFGTAEQASREAIASIRKAASGARAFAGIEAGPWLLARAGLLDGRRATTHWEDLEDFAAAFPATDVRPDRYVIDGPAITTGGAAPTFDLMLQLIRTRLGPSTALDAASVFIYEPTHAASDAQPAVSLSRAEAADPRLAKALRLMEASVDEPPTVASIARRCGLTTRGLEKLFARTLDATPGQWFLRLRLSAARRLVKDTSAPLAEIAARTGFSSASSLSRAFSATFGVAPARMRRGNRPGQFSPP